MACVGGMSMKDAGGLGDKMVETSSAAPAASVKRAVARAIAAEKQAAAQEKKVVSGQMRVEDLEQERLIVKKTVEKKTVTKKPVEKKETAVKTVSVTKAAEAQQEVKPAEEKKPVETKKAEPKPAAAKASKPVAAKNAKSAAKTAAKEPFKKIEIQFHGNNVNVDDLIEKVKAAYAAEGNSAATVKNIELYIKPEENMVYYVIDGYASGTSIY